MKKKKVNKKCMNILFHTTCLRSILYHIHTTHFLNLHSRKKRKWYHMVIYLKFFPIWLSYFFTLIFNILLMCNNFVIIYYHICKSFRYVTFIYILYSLLMLTRFGSVLYFYLISVYL